MPKIPSLLDYAFREFSDGVALGVAASTLVAGFVDVSDNSFDHPYLIGIPFVASMALGAYTRIKHGSDKGLSKLVSELERKLH